MSEVALSTVPRIGAGFRLQFEPVQDCHVLLYPEGMVKLNAPAAEILQRCNGTRTVAEVVAELEGAFSTTGLQGDVLSFIAMAGQQRWLAWK
jgi:pyrroloquinoline quinone biosynthesis protein D